MERTAATTIEAYMDAQSPANKAALQKLRKAIKAAAPKAEEFISYQIPSYKYLYPLVYMGGFKNHCSLFVINKPIIEALKEELKDFKTSGTTIHFRPEQPLPDALVKKIVQMRIEQNEARFAAKKKATKI